MRPLLALFFRSIREQARNKFTPLVRGVMVCIILLFIVGIQDKPWITSPGRGFFMSLVSINLFFIALAALSTFSSVITEEKEEGTLGLLRMTNLNPVSILLGKSTSRLCGILLLMAAQFPFTVLAVTLGGVSLNQIFAAYAVLVSLTFFLCNLALLGSVICQRTRKASRFTLAYAFCLYAVLPWIYGAITSFGFNINPTPAMQFWAESLKYFLEANPLYVLFGKIASTTFSGPILGFQFWTHIVGGILLFALSALIFERFCGSAAEVAGQTTKKAKAGSKGARRSRVWNSAAIAWKDFHFFYGGKKGQIIRISTFCLLIGLNLGIMHWGMKSARQSLDSNIIGGTLLMWAIVLACIEILSVSVGILGKERKYQTMSSLVTLPISTGEIIRQKLFGALPLFAFPLLLLVVGSALNPEPIREFFGGIIKINRIKEFFILLYIGLQFLIVPVLIVNLSLRFRRAALPITIGIMFAFNFVTGIFILMLREPDAVVIPVLGLIVALVVLIKQIFALIPRAAAEN